MIPFRYFTLMTLTVALWLVLSAGFPTFAQTPTLYDLYSFSGSDGASPFAALIQARDGNLYGTTYKGGANNYGTVYKLTPSGTLTTLHSFSGPPSDGANPWAGLIQARDGNLYGTTYFGGIPTFDNSSGWGAIFRITTAGELTNLHFCDSNDTGFPIAGLIQASDGNLYGTESGDQFNYGSIYKITTAGTPTNLHEFDGYPSDGGNPWGGLVQASDGNFYGTTYYGGANNLGTVFKLTTAGTLATLYSFSGSDGEFPVAGLVQANDGNLYGTATYGGAIGYGTIFRITTGGAFTSIHSFSGSPSDGAYPYSALIQAGDGNLYGTTAGGGAAGYGTIFRITTSEKLTTLYSFSGNGGINPRAGLIEGRDGFLYGTTYRGGANNDGSVFVLDGVYPFPYLSGLSPSPIDAGGPALTLTVKGEFFQPFSIVNWNGSPLATTSLSASELKATVPASLIASSGKATVTVVTGAGGGASGAKTLTILLTTVKPTSATLAKNNDGSYTVSLSLKNMGYNTASNVTLTKASLNAVNTTTSLPVTVGSIAAGASGNVSLVFPASTGASGSVVMLKVSGKFSGGTFSGSLKVTLP